MQDSAVMQVQAIRDRVAADGWIPRKAEAFRHLPPPPAAVWLGDSKRPPGPTLDDGWRLRPAADGTGAAADLRWFDLSDPAQRSELFAGLPAPGDDDAAPFEWAHRALVRKALRVRVASADSTTLLHLEHHAGEAVEAPLLILELLPGARCVLLETQVQKQSFAVVQNLRLQVRLAEGADLQHLRLAAPQPADRWAHHLHVQVGRRARYAQCLLGTASDYHLQRSVVDLQDEGACAQLAGVLLAAGGGLEQQVVLGHAAPGTHSSVEMLALPSAAARVVASAHTRIAAGSDDAEARQRLCGIPTAGQPRIVLRPHLEIHHDQVQATHGATWGALPADALFHARQRGLDETAAKALILAGLARSVLARAIDGASLPESLRLDGALEAALARQLGAGSPQAQEVSWAE